MWLPCCCRCSKVWIGFSLERYRCYGAFAWDSVWRWLPPTDVLPYPVMWDQSGTTSHSALILLSPVCLQGKLRRQAQSASKGTQMVSTKASFRIMGKDL